MPLYSVRLVCEAGHGLVAEEPLARAEETLAVEAPSLWEARSRSFSRMTIQPMGRLILSYDASTGEEIGPPPLAPLRPGRFELGGLSGSYDGYTRDEHWNGWAVPFFPLDEALRIADDYAAQPAGVDGLPRSEYHEGRDVVRLYDPSSGEWDEYAGEDVEGQVLYPVGAQYWTWEEASPRA